MQNSITSRGRKGWKAGENHLDPKCYCSLNVDQEILDQHKSSNSFDKNYDTPLANLESLLPESPLLKKFNKSPISYDDFVEILATPRNASAFDLNGIPLQGLPKMFQNK